jgi:hypothetical protein
MMHDRLFHVCDALAVVIGATVTTAATAVMGVVRPYNPEDQLWQTLLPLIGATLTSLGAVLLNPQSETRKIVMGRAAFGFFAGIVSPSLFIAILPNVIPESWLWMVEVLRWPGALILVGGVVSYTFYVLSRPFCARAYERADAIAKAQVKRLERLAQGPNNTVIVVDPQRMPGKPPSPEDPE